MYTSKRNSSILKWFRPEPRPAQPDEVVATSCIQVELNGRPFELDLDVFRSTCILHEILDIPVPVVVLVDRLHEARQRQVEVR